MSDLFTDAGPWLKAGALIVVTFVVIALLYVVARRLVRKRPVIRAAFDKTHRPVQAVALVIVMRATVSPLLESWRGAATHALDACLVIAIAWLTAAVLVRIEDRVLARLGADADNHIARRMRTQVTIVRRVTVASVAVIAIGAVLLTIPQARTAGASVLASAGLIGLVAALAAQTTLGNLFAGVYLAFGNALRLDDVVVVEGEWGRIEEITLGYVVVRIWDDRRLIMPSSYFTTTPFQNWTRTSGAVTGTAELDVDWTVPVDQMREEAQRIVEESPQWDERAFALHITAAVGGLVRARIMVSAANSGDLWDLRCLVRERLVGWLQREHPSALPRQRAELVGAASLPSTGTSSTNAVLPAR